MRKSVKRFLFAALISLGMVAILVVAPVIVTPAHAGCCPNINLCSPCGAASAIASVPVTAAIWGGGAVAWGAETAVGIAAYPLTFIYNAVFAGPCGCGQALSYPCFTCPSIPACACCP